MKLVNKRLAALLGGSPLGLLLSTNSAQAESSLNMTRGATSLSAQVYDLHMLLLWICVVIGVLVFGAILYSVIKFRKSKGAVPAQFHHSTTVEIIWTVIPMLILIVVAVPSTRVLVEMDDTSEADLSIQVTGYQWKWGYHYRDEGFSFMSTLSAADNTARQLGSGIDPNSIENYLLNVDEPIVIPVGKKVRFLLTSNDVIHSWWVPALGWKKDAIPGFINEAWARVDKPGIYRGQCAELCGRDHAFMPVVVHAVSEEEYQQWVQKMKARYGTDGAAAPAQAAAEQPAAPAPAEQPAAQERAEAPAAEEAAAPAQEAAPAAQPVSAELSKDELMARGEKVYGSFCAACHMPNGEGMPGAGFKPIKGSPVATGPVEKHLSVVLKGVPGTGMAPFGHMSDEDIAAVVTYQRNAFGNDVGDVVQPADVKAAR